LRSRLVDFAPRDHQTTRLIATILIDIGRWIAGASGGHGSAIEYGSAMNRRIEYMVASATMLHSQGREVIITRRL
jgi:hypothetical protein